jgi:hypothetical protein
MLRVGSFFRKGVAQLMRSWKHLNHKGKILLVCCVINMIVSVVLARAGDWACVFSVSVAAYCGMSTYSKRYQYLDAEDINEKQ